VRSFVVLVGSLLLARPLAAAPAVEVHSLQFLVHSDLVTAQEPFSFWQDLIREAVLEATILLQGASGPFDTPCCVRLDGVSVGTFDGTDVGRPAGDLFVLDSGADYDDLATLGTGSRAFVVDSITYCGGFAPLAIGCANQPGCPQPAGDNPDLVLVVTRDARDSGRFVSTLAHERGHTTCLGHLDANACQLMRPSAGGDCLDATECGHYLNGGITGVDACVCADDLGGVREDGSACVDGALQGICSGGVCGESGSDASVTLLAAGGPGAAQGITTDELLRLSGLTGDWVSEGPFAMSFEPQGLAFDPARDRLYAVAPSAGDDQLLELDPATGAVLATRTVVGHQQLISLAFDPGPTGGPGDDRLLALDDDPASAFEDLIEIDPDTGSANVLGGLSSGFGGGFQGLAYDADAGVLYAAAHLGGVWTVATSCSGLCSVVDVMDVPVRGDPGLAWSADTGRLYIAGFQANTPTLVDAIDPGNGFEVSLGLGIDPFTAGGLAALPVPEAPELLGGFAALTCVVWLARTRGRSTRRV
jgi:DNA-binding beta-propeller fold protein YncE